MRDGKCFEPWSDVGPEALRTGAVGRGGGERAESDGNRKSRGLPSRNADRECVRAERRVEMEYVAARVINADRVEFTSHFSSESLTDSADIEPFLNYSHCLQGGSK